MCQPIVITAPTEQGEDAEGDEEESDDHKDNPDPSFNATILSILIAVVSHVGSLLRVSINIIIGDIAN